MVNPVIAGIIIGIMCAIGGYIIGFISCAALVKMMEVK